MYQHNQQLPAPVDQILQQQMVHPQQTAVPNVQSVQMIGQQNAQSIHMALINELQSGVQRSPIRICLFNMLSAAHYQNQAYATLFDRTLMYAAAMMQMQQQITPEQVARDAIIAEMAVILNQYQALYNFLNQQQYQDSQYAQQKAAEMKQIIDRAFSGGPQMGGGMSTGYGGHPAGGGGPAYAGGGPPNMAGNVPVHSGPPGGGYPPGPGGPVTSGPGGPGAYQGRPGPGAGHVQRPMGSASTNRRSNAGGLVDSGAPSAPSGQGSPAMSRASTNAPHTPSGPPMAHEPMKPNETTTNKGAEPMKHIDEETRELGHYMQVDESAVSDFLEESSSIAPPQSEHYEFASKRYVPARRHDQKLVKRFDEHGVPLFYLIPQEDAHMEYADHEQDMRMRELARSETIGPKVKREVKWDDVSIPNEVDPSSKDKLEFGENDPIILKAPVNAYSIDHGTVLAYDKLRENGINTFDGRVTEYYIHRMTPLPIIDSEADALKELIDGSENLTDLIDGFRNLSDTLTSPLWYRLHDMMTEVVNERLAVGLAFDGNIDSITGDFDALDEALKDEYPQSGIERFRKNVRTALMGKLNLVNYDSHHCLKELNSVTQLPWSSEQIDLSLGADYTMISVAANQHLHAAAVKLTRRTNLDKFKVIRRYMVTVDDIWIEVHLGDLTADTILVRKLN